MFSTIALAKDSKLSGKMVGTHQKLDQAARASLGKILPRGKYFPIAKEILHFEGSRGPDGLKRKSPGIDEPSHMLVGEPELNFGAEHHHAGADERSVLTMILDHHWNLVRALRSQDHIRAAYEAAWMAHMIVDGLTPAHHFPLTDIKDELMTDKEMVKFFGEPLKGVMHGRNPLETMRNNWLYWGAGGHMTKHIAYEYGALMIAAAMPSKALEVNLSVADLQNLNTEQLFCQSLAKIRQFKMYDRFLAEGWTTELARETKEVLFPEMVKVIALAWYSAASEAYQLQPQGEANGAES